MSEEFDMEAFNRQVTEEFRASGGRVGGMFEGATLLILHTTGAKSGAARDNPLVYRQEGDRRFVFASAGGAPNHPAWYHNIVAHPEIEVEIGADTLAVRGQVVAEPERSEIYARQAADMPQFGDYEQQTAGVRTIPVVELVAGA